MLPPLLEATPAKVSATVSAALIVEPISIDLLYSEFSDGLIGVLQSRISH